MLQYFECNRDLMYTFVGLESSCHEVFRVFIFPKKVKTLVSHSAHKETITTAKIYAFFNINRIHQNCSGNAIYVCIVPNKNTSVRDCNRRVIGLF